MDSALGSQEHGEEALHEPLDRLHIGTSAIAVSADDPDSNPWEDSTTTSLAPDLGGHNLRIPDPSSLDDPTTHRFTSEAGEKMIHTNADVLLEFDPLASAEEKAARDAWADSPAHPPPSRTDESPTIPPNLPAKNAEGTSQTSSQLSSTPNRPSSPIPAFPTLAALARSFSLPLGARSQRSRSLDMATPVPSPATLSSFAQQQSAPPTGKAAGDGSNASTEPSGSGRSAPAQKQMDRVRDKSRDKDNPPFDFQRFLDQMKMRSAEPVAKYLRSFLSNFAKRTFTVTDQVKLINDFLNFISVRMREVDVWRNATDAEFDNAMEGMEKLVMNRLYEFTFTPQVARMVPPRPVTVDDLERDRVLSQRISLFRWIEPKHLDVPEGEGSEGFLMFAQQELLKVNHYKAPRDKLICILNCCKVIFGLIRHLHKEEGADTFVPILIYVVLKANPPHLLSNVEFINRFRNPEKLQSEAGYYLSSLMGAVSFIETMDHTSLSNISQEEFERNVEDVIQSLPSSGSRTPESATPLMPASPPAGSLSASLHFPHTGEESAQPLALSTPAQTLGEDARRFLQKTGDTISKPLSAISRIFNEVLDGAEGSLSHIPGQFGTSELSREQQQLFEQDRQVSHALMVPQTPAGVDENGQQMGTYHPPLQTPYKPRVRRVPSPLSSAQSSGSFQFGSPMVEDTPTRQRGSVVTPYTNQPLSIGPSQSATALQYSGSRPRELWPQSAHVSRTPTPNLDLAGLQDEIDRAHEKAAVASLETLRQIFPTTDTEVVEWVLEANEGDLGKSIEALLEMSSGT
ncbi:hypothetical protein AcW1_006520 [Taiwanofungus camphoratus]|nr:hypothetical protein AcW1_006520 [Antrodia cinnamomea]